MFTDKLSKMVARSEFFFAISDIEHLLRLDKGDYTLDGM